MTDGSRRRSCCGLLGPVRQTHSTHSTQEDGFSTRKMLQLGLELRLARRRREARKQSVSAVVAVGLRDLLGSEVGLAVEDGPGQEHRQEDGPGPRSTMASSRVLRAFTSSRAILQNRPKSFSQSTFAHSEGPRLYAWDSSKAVRWSKFIRGVP